MIESVVVTLLPLSFLAVLFGGGALFRRRNIDMDGEAPINKALFVGSKYAIMVLWAAVVMRGWGIDLAVIEGPGLLKWVSLCLWASGFVLLFLGRFWLGASFRIGSPREPTGLRVDGLFSLSRNPMYVGVYATLVASVLYTLNPAVLVVAAFIIAVHHRIVLAEEEHLRETFGAEYSDYCRRVRRYL